MFDLLSQFELPILDFIQSIFKNSFFDVFFPILCFLVNHGELWILVAIVLLFIKKYRKDGLALSIALLMHLIIVNLLIKPLFARVRPYDINEGVELLVEKLLDASFPSGHTSVCFAATVVLWHFNKKVGILSLVYSLLVAFGRLYLYVHFPSDVIFGAIFGIIFGFASLYITNYIYKKDFLKKIW